MQLKAETTEMGKENIRKRTKYVIWNSNQRDKSMGGCGRLA
jgi:hypothetical protein